MNKALMYLLLCACFDALACRTADWIDGIVIQFSYVDPMGTYEVKVPAKIGDAKLGNVSLYGYQDFNGDNRTRERHQGVTMHSEGEFMVGQFQAKSQEGFTYFIFADWRAPLNYPCPIASRKKVKLFD